MAELNWTDAQWQKVNDTVNEAFRQASVAGALLPMYGPLTGSAEIVRNERLQEDAQSDPPTIRLDRDHRSVNLKLVNLTTNVELASEQVADETLANAQLAFRRAANILALEQDRVIFAGYQRGFARENSPYVMNQVDPQKGLADLPARLGFSPVGLRTRRMSLGQLVVRAVVKAMTDLEDASNPPPYGCVLGNDLYEAVYEPSNSLVLPSDRITPLLKGGPLLRSGKIEPGTGIVVSLSSHVVDIVVGTPPTVQFLQRTANAKFLFRVYVRFALRFREGDVAKSPVAGFRVLPNPQAIATEQARVAALNS